MIQIRNADCQWTCRGVRLRSAKDAVDLARMAAQNALPMCQVPLYDRARDDVRPGDVFCFDDASLQPSGAQPWDDRKDWAGGEVAQGFRVHSRFDELGREVSRKHLAAHGKLNGERRTVHVVAYDYLHERPEDGLRPLEDVVALRVHPPSRKCTWPSPRALPPSTATCPLASAATPVTPYCWTPSLPSDGGGEGTEYPEAAYPTPRCSPCAPQPSRAASSAEDADSARQSVRREHLSVASVRGMHPMPTYEEAASRLEHHKRTVLEPPFSPRRDWDEEMLARLPPKL